MRRYTTEAMHERCRAAWKAADPWKAADDPERPYVTALQTTDGTEHRTNGETPDEAEARLIDAGYLVQRCGDLVRMVALLSPAAEEGQQEARAER